MQTTKKADKINWNLSDNDIQKQLFKLPMAQLLRLCKSKKVATLDDNKKNIISRLIENNQSKRKEKALRRKWKEGSICEIYSKTKKAWCQGQIIGVTSDQDGEWLQVKYGKTSKEIQRFSHNIRPLPLNKRDSSELQISINTQNNANLTETKQNLISIKINCEFKNDIVEFSFIEKHPSLLDLNQLVLNQFKISNFWVEYIHSDAKQRKNYAIGIFDSIDFDEAIQYVYDNNKNVLEISVYEYTETDVPLNKFSAVDVCGAIHSQPIAQLPQQRIAGINAMNTPMNIFPMTVVPGINISQPYALPQMNLLTMPMVSASVPLQGNIYTTPINYNPLLNQGINYNTTSALFNQQMSSNMNVFK